MNKSWNFEEIIDTLKQAPLFRELSPRSLRSLAKGARGMTLLAKEHLWREGDPASHLGFVVSGKLKIVHVTSRGEIIMDIAIPGNMLGEVAFSLDAHYQTDVVCLRRATVVLLAASKLRALLIDEPDVAQILAMDLAQHVVRLYHTMHALSEATVERRLARILLRLTERTGEPFPGGILIPMRLRRVDLAAMTGTTLESISRKISIWKRAGWLDPQPAGYLIRNKQALQAILDKGE